MAKKTLDINPVFKHRDSDGLLVTAEDLVDSLDNLSICLSHIEEKYIEQTVYTLTKRLLQEPFDLDLHCLTKRVCPSTTDGYEPDCRLSEHAHCTADAQELQETTEAEKTELAEQLEQSKKNVEDLESKLQKVTSDLRKSKMQRTDSVVRMEYDEMKNENEVLLMENKRLKEMIREKDSELDRISISSAGDSQAVSRKDSNTDSNSVCSENSGGPTFIRQTSEVAYV